MKDDYISRQAEIDAVRSFYDDRDETPWISIEERIEALPPADVQIFKWIPRNKESPKEWQGVIVTVNDGLEYISIDMWTGTEFHAYGYRVTAWMPLPKPYCGGESK